MTEQLSLFSGEADPAGPRGGRVPAAAPHDPDLTELGSRLPPALYLGTSSWTFPGWAGIVYDTPYEAALLSKSGLPAYAAHPLFRTVSIDRTYYAPIPADAYAACAAQVPDGFRFMVKAPADVTSPWLRGDDTGRAAPNPHYLDASRAAALFVRPACEGLGRACGPLVLQFPPQGRSVASRPRTFATRVAGFLEALPEGPVYAIELRDADLWTDELVAAIRRTGVHMCLSIHPRAPSLAMQQAILSSLGGGPLVARWNLHPGHRYEEAKARYAPFDRMVEPDAHTRQFIADTTLAALRAGREAFVVANNKAEGSAPLTIAALAATIVAAA